MQLPAPESLADIIADGAIAQADISAGLSTRIGEVSRVEFTRGHTAAGERTEVAIRGRSSGEHVFPAVPVATISADQWTWLGEAPFPIPELAGTQPASDRLIAAARTLHGNAPAFLVPDQDGTTTVVVIETELPQAPPRLALITGLANLPAGVDVRRALLGFAAARRLGVQATPQHVSFSDGTVVALAGDRVVDVSGGMTLPEVRADALYHSVEHQFFFDGVLPHAQVHLDVAAGTARIVSGEQQLAVAATVIASMDGHSWRWAWADPDIRDTPAAEGARSLHHFGMDQGIPEFFTATLPLAYARSQRLHVAAKPVVHRWTHATARLDETRWAVVLLDDPRLHLPAPTRDAVVATLETPLPAGLDGRRAVAAYARLRGLRVANTADQSLVYVGGEPISVNLT